MRAQLIELQTQLAFQEDALHTLDGVVAAQQLRLDKMEQMNARLERQLAQMLTALDERGDEPPPPHY
jgi:SlyX protein